MGWKSVGCSKLNEFVCFLSNPIPFNKQIKIRCLDIKINLEFYSTRSLAVFLAVPVGTLRSFEISEPWEGSSLSQSARSSSLQQAKEGRNIVLRSDYYMFYLCSYKYAAEI
jgi:hypothetical protein